MVCATAHTNRAADWKVPTTFIYGTDDWMDYRAAQEARKLMNVPTELIRVPQACDSIVSVLDYMQHTCVS